MISRNHKIVKKKRDSGGTQNDVILVRPKAASRIVFVSLIFLLVGLGLFIWQKAKPAQAVPWASTLSEWGKRKQETLVNNSGQTLNSNTTYTINIDTSSAINFLQSCDDLRVVYQPSSTTATELPRSVTNCATTATSVSFPLQASLANGASDANYYVYYNNSHSPAYGGTTALSAFDPTPGAASFVLPAAGSTTALASGSGVPTTATGAIRYSGGKSALSFDGNSDYVTLTATANGVKTVSFWIYPNSTSTPLFDLGGGVTATISAGTVTLAGFTSPTTYVNGVATSTIAANAWSHLAITTNTAFNTSSGNFGQVKGSYFNGKIDEVRLSNNVRYNGAFTPTLAPFVRDSNTLVIYHFDENGSDPRTANTAFDDSGNGNDGTITGATYVSGLVGVDNSSSWSGAIGSSSFASHQGVFIEEGTTNKITNPSFENSTSFSTNWATSSGVLNYSASSHTFTPSIAKRTTSAGPFTTGVMVQGKADGTGTGDNLTSSAGTQINGNFYQNFDANQGTIAFWVTPEWNGNDGVDHMLIYAGGSNYFHKTTGNILHAYWGNSQIFGPSIASWAAGSTYLVVFRWDSKNSLDGTNKTSITVNNTTTFVNAAPDGSGSGFPINIGSQSGGSPANAIIQGLTIYRRPLYEATTPSGINVGNGDEISQIYNSGTGKDPTLVTGSWDVVFALPTNQTAGALATGTGNAWSHPHSSNLLYTSTTNTGGFMMGADYGTDGWSAVGTPTTIASLSTANKIFAGGYYTVSDGATANQGIQRSFSATANANYVIRALGNADAGHNCTPAVKIFRADGTTLITSLAGTTTSTRAAPDTYIFTYQAPATENNLVELLNTAATGTCSWHQVEVQNNLIANPSMETGSGNPFIPTGWSNNNLTSGESTQETTTTHSGANSLKWVAANQLSHGIIQNVSVTSGLYYGFGALLNMTSGVLVSQLGGSRVSAQNSNTLGPQSTYISTTGWNLSTRVGRAISSGTTTFAVVTQTGITTGYGDDVFVVPLTGVSLTLTPASEANSTETSGLRVDGADTLTQTVTNLASSSGEMAFQFTPRHSFSVSNKFGSSYPVIASASASPTDGISLVAANANTLRLTATMSGTTVNTLAASPTLNAGTTYDFVIKYATNGTLDLYVNGTKTGTSGSIGSSTKFTTVPTTFYFGSDKANANQYDGTFNTESTYLGISPIYANTTSPYVKFGSQSTQLITQDSTVYSTNISPGNTNANTLSAYVYYGGNTVDGSVAALWWEGRVINTTYTDAGGGWWRLSYSSNTSNSSNSYGLWVAPGKTVYVDGVQLEEKAYATTYADGTLGTGYAWTGTANNSTSTRTATNIQYSPASNINASAGTISLWVKPFRIDPVWGTADFSTVQPGGGNFSSIVLKNQGADSWVTAVDNAGNSKTFVGSSVVVLNKWYHVVIVWGNSGASCTAYFNGAVYSSTLGTGTCNLTGFGNISFTDASSTTLASNTISDFRIFNSALSAGQVSQLYYASLASHSEAGAVNRFSGPEDPVAYWKFDEGTGTTLNNSAPNIQTPGTLTGSLTASMSGLVNPPTWQTEDQCVSGKCLFFEGSDASASATATVSGIMSVAFWEKYASASSALVPFLNLTSVTVAANYLGTVTATGSASPTVYINGKSGGTLTPNTWNYVEVTTATPFTITNPVIGQIGQTNYRGYLDEVKFYNYQRTAAQVLADYKNGLRGSSVNVGGPATAGLLASGLVGYWKMDEATWSGTLNEVVDSSGNGNNGQAQGATGGKAYPSAGKFGNGGFFDGVDDYVDTNSNATNLGIGGNTSRTFSFWAYTAGGSYEEAYGMHKGINYQDFSLRYNGSATWEHVITNVTCTFSLDIRNVWTMITVTYDGQSIKNYGNGALINSCAVALNTATDKNLIIGDIPSFSSGSKWNGKLDEFRVYNRALSPAEVRQLYNFAPGPTRYYKLDEGSGTAPVDSSGNGATGSENGSPTWTSGKFGKGLKLNGSGQSLQIPNF